MTLDRYFKQKHSLPNLHGDLSLNINHAVITAMNHEVMSEINTMSGSGQAPGAKKCQPLCKNREQNFDIVFGKCPCPRVPDNSIIIFNSDRISID